ncbi:hypothetical protein BM536_020595 [Streptomyces phaeoluteigriseus]|uniref:Gram-positive cocci surface proteins LPxTG domain-containing protein n=1 Tax=Streptomyces phaeoluteigriseus TaxID=114686 RepID=A0A1V6MQ21_9ACTN|nr:hypothetical protein [Streptomyces phaeoluteigriseus]OQD54396.1 hypothetical protein BM536_020595 [Streptomyces phaeoluteigriseus]
MPTSSRPRRVATLTALAAGGAVLLGAPAAVAAPGDNGDVKVHMAGTAVSAQANQPKVCKFYLDAFNFDVAQGINWTIAPQSAQAGTTATLSGTVTLANGAGVTENLMLPDGQYKLTWVVVGGSGAGKQKVFKVDCPDRPNGPGGPNGGPPAGGGGLARDAAFTPVAGAAAVGLAAVGGAAWFRLRRRSHGAA